MYKFPLIYRYNALSLTLFSHFLYVECNGEEGKVHCYFVLAEVSEPFVSHIEFYRKPIIRITDNTKLYDFFGFINK